MAKKKSVKKKDNDKIKIKLFDSKADVIATILLVIAGLIVLLSPKAYTVKTARWTDWSEKRKGYVYTAMGDKNTEERFRLYFQYYNVVHELGHGLITYNHGVDVHIVDEEQLVNDFAVAYWRYYGDPEKIEELHDIVNYAVENVGDNYKNGVDYIKHAKKHSDGEDFDGDFFNFEDYGWFQFSSVKHSIENEKSLEEVLKEMGFKNFKLNKKKLLLHNNMSEEESIKVINEAVINFRDWGLKFPKTYQSFSNDPNANWSKPSKNYLGLYDLIYKNKTDN